MFSRTPNKKSRGFGYSGTSGKRQKGNELIHDKKQSNNVSFQSPNANVNQENRFSSNEADVHANKNSISINSITDSIGLGSRKGKGVTIDRKLGVLNENANLNPFIFSAQLFSNGDLLTIYNNDTMMLHQDTHENYHGISTQLSVPNRINSKGAILVDILSLQGGQRREIATCSSNGNFKFHSLDSDGRVHTQECDIQVDLNGSIITSLIHPWTGESILGTSDSKLFSVHSSPSGLRWQELKVVQTGLWGFVSRLGLIRGTQSTTEILSNMTKGTRHGGRLLPEWTNDTPAVDPIYNLLAVNHGRILAVGNRIQLWGGCSSSDGQISELWACDVHRAIFNVANDRDIGDPGGYEGHNDISIVHSMLHPVNPSPNSDKLTLLVLAVSRQSSNIGEDTNESSRGTLWLLTVVVPLNGGDSPHPECRHLKDGVDLNSIESGHYVPTLHCVGDGEASCFWISAGKQTLNSMSLHGPGAQLDTGLEYSSIITSSAWIHDDALVAVLRADDYLVKVRQGHSVGAHTVRSSPDFPKGLKNPANAIEHVRRTLVAASVASSDDNSMNILRGLLAEVSGAVAEEAALAASATIADRVPAGQHWGGSSSGEAQLGLLILQEKKINFEKFMQILDDLGMLQAEGLSNQLHAVYNHILAAFCVCQCLVTGGDRSSPVKTIQSNVDIRRSRSGSTSQIDPLLDTLDAAPRMSSISSMGIIAYALDFVKAPLRKGIDFALQNANEKNFESRGLSLIDAFFSNLTALDERLAFAIINALAQHQNRDDMVLPLGILLTLSKALALSRDGASTLCESKDIRDSTRAALVALCKSVPNTEVYALNSWRIANCFAVRDVCAILLNSYAEDARVGATQDDYFTAVNGIHMEEQWKAEYAETLSIVNKALILLYSPQVAFEQAEINLDGEGLMSACEEDESLRPMLVQLCSNKGNMFCTQGEQLASFLLKRCTDDSNCILQGTLPLIFDIGKVQPEQWTMFLQDRPHLRWLHCLTKDPIDFAGTSSALSEVVRTPTFAPKSSEDRKTLDSLSKLTSLLLK